MCGGKETEVTQVTVTWEASEKLRKQEYTETGERPDAGRRFTLNLKELTQEERKPIVEHLGLHIFTLGMETAHIFSEKWPITCFAPRRLAFDQQPTVDDILDYVKSETASRDTARAHKAKIDAAKKANRVQLQGHYDNFRQEIDALVESGDLTALEEFRYPPVKGVASFKPSGGRSGLYKLLSDAITEVAMGIENARKAKREADKAEWIEAHSSEHLKRAHGGGYDAQRLYVTERADKEAPGFIVDFDGAAEWKDRSCPSLEALDAEAEAEALRVGDGVKVVWLTNPAVNEVGDEKAYYYVFDECEAVVIRTYLGKYNLVQEL